MQECFGWMAKENTAGLNGYTMLANDYFLSEDVVGLARDLIGKLLCSNIDQKLVCGIITESEAYAGVNDKASHAYDGRNTSRTRIMFREGGCAYIYLCYGVHSLFNVVTAGGGIPHAVLIRSVLLTEGIPFALHRLQKKAYAPALTKGPGRVSKAMGFHYSQSGYSLQGPHIYIEDCRIAFPTGIIQAGPRIGVDYAGEDALLPYRFFIDHNDLSG